ncbi:beta/gamma crystallin family protein [Phenylobacterium sp. J367]|uniref:beta/gamma crystallin family protein n=1 Tax=Phenylobacterium sp. J367 TaxID=2898435 RepID=UPI002150868F|nr:beta/gamma crystallin family protein [Phenylobacterium sp. J367]MCR5878938.1 beta/gamma crystallin family protein [Phenylobacterium sp. J367]
MSKTTILIGAAIAALAIAGAADAQPRGGRGPSATLYEGPNFTGRSVTIVGDVSNLGSYNFNDKARSVRLEGRWRLCEHSNFEGRCVEQAGEIPELNTLALAERITSLEPIGGGGRPGGGRPDWNDDRPGGGWGQGGGRPDARGVDGERSVFFARPQVRGLDLAAGSNNANAFCRRQGLGNALYFDSSSRAPRALGPEGQMTGPSTVLRDVLCRKY